MLIGEREFADSGKTYIMGILNVTPDSFSDGGRYDTFDSALFHAEEMVREGCDIIDIGAESTRPGYTPVSDIEELNRLLPVLRAIKERFDVPVSIDTYKGGVARTVLLEGADMINDIGGLLSDDETARAAGETGAAYCYMHNRTNTNYGILLRDVFTQMEEGIKKALDAGVSPDRLMIDPGIGFGKTYEQNLVLLKHTAEFSGLGYPVLLGVSRKSVIGKALDLPVDERLEGTLATTAYAVLNGASFVRVHDVAENKRVIDMLEAVVASDR